MFVGDYLAVYSRLPMSFISRYTTGDLASRVNSISQLRQLLGSGVLTTVLSTLFSLSYFVLMFVDGLKSF